MKTILAILLSAFVLAACGGGDPEPVPQCASEDAQHKHPKPDPCEKHE